MARLKPFVKRGKTDAADAQAICEAVIRKTMRFVAQPRDTWQPASRHAFSQGGRATTDLPGGVEVLALRLWPITHVDVDMASTG